MTDAEKLILQTWEDEAVAGLLGAYDRAAARTGVSPARVAEVVGRSLPGFYTPPGHPLTKKEKGDGPWLAP